jgi:hypothetical protein
MHRFPSEPGRANRGLIGLVIALALSVGWIAPASAHGGDESMEGYLLVQQALGHLAHDKTDAGVDLAMEKIDDALAAEDQDGVDVAELEAAQAALEAGEVVQAQQQLQESIAEALSALEPAVGEETGTTIVLDPLPGRGSLTAFDWALLVLSFVTLAAGLGLAWIFRPKDTVHDLHERLADPADPTTEREMA